MECGKYLYFPISHTQTHTLLVLIDKGQNMPGDSKIQREV